MNESLHTHEPLAGISAGGACQSRDPSSGVAHNRRDTPSSGTNRVLDSACVWEGGGGGGTSVDEWCHTYGWVMSQI